MNKFINLNIITLIILIILTSNKVYKDGMIPTCDNYVSNVYLYLLIWIELATILTYYFMNNPTEINSIMLYAMLFLEITILIFFSFISPKKQILKHILAIMFIAIGSFILGNCMKYFNLSESIIYSMLILSILIFIVMSFFGFLYKDKITEKMITIYAILLIIYLLFEIISIFFIKYGGKNERIITFIGLIIISGWLMFKTKELVIESKNCVYPDYVGSSMSFFITIKNIFIRLLELKSK